jgi:hypothetical protein
MATQKTSVTQTKKTAKTKTAAQPAPTSVTAAAIPAVLVASPAPAPPSQSVMAAPAPNAGTPSVVSSLPALVAAAASTTDTSSLITTTANGGNHGKKTDAQAAYQATIYGLITYYEPTDTFLMQAGTFTRDELVTEFQAFVQAAQATKSSNQEWRGNVQTERALETHVRTLRQGVKGIVQARFGPTGVQCMQFGFTLPKPRVKTATTKAVAVQKALATREERGTMGKKKKAAIHGNVNVALVVTPGSAGNGAAAAPVAASAPQQVAAAPAAPAVAPVVVAAPAAAPAVAGSAPIATPVTVGVASNGQH